MATVKPPDTTACRDGCGRTVLDDQLLPSGWTFLPISRRWRCPACWRALEALKAADERRPSEGG